MSETFPSVMLLIPAYKPDEALVSLDGALREAGFSRIIVVNDGTPEKALFDHLASRGATVLPHETNRGKGAALKTGFSYILNDGSAGASVIITLDADGQHVPEDVVNVAQAAIARPESLVLGARRFGPDIPLRSRFGNIMTRVILDLSDGVRLQDTQTGLRAYPRALAQAAVGLGANRYGFELDVIRLAQRHNIPITEVPIKTVYIDGNQSSHFRPVLDSARIYARFGRYLAVLVLAALLDVLAFMTLLTAGNGVIASILIARALSTALYYFGVKFPARGWRPGASGRFFLHAGAIGLLSALAVALAAALGAEPLLAIKVVADLALFFLARILANRMAGRN